MSHFCLINFLLDQQINKETVCVVGVRLEVGITVVTVIRYESREQ